MAFKKIVLEGEATISSFAGSSIQTSGESFADNDTSLMTSASINDRITAISSNTSGTVTSVGGTGTVNGLTLTGTVTGSGNLTLGGTLAVGAGQIDANAVGNSELGPDAVRGANIGDSEIDSEHYVDGSIDAVHLGATPVNNKFLKYTSLGDLSWADPPSTSLSDLGITATASELNKMDGVTATATEINLVDGLTATTAELNKMDGVTATTAELNYSDGVTSNIQTQLDAKTSNTGDITAVVAGSGMTGGATSGSATVNVIGGDGITANADDIEVDSTVIRTTGNQTIGGTKTFSSDVVFTGDIIVNGNTITTDTETLEINNHSLVLNANANTAVDAGFLVERGFTGDNQVLHWDESYGSWRNATTTASDVVNNNSYVSDITNTLVNSSFSNSSTAVPVGHFQWDGSDLYVRTS